MGLLDDAIREHLDLKRRRGTDPDEIERLEREALGPVRRSPQEAYDAPPLAEAGQEPVDVGDEAAESSPAPEDDSFAADPGHEPAGADELEDWEVPARAPIEGAIGAEPDIAAPTPPARTPAERTPDSGSLVEDDYLEQETVEHDVEHEAGAAEEDDMLEETPEFLQDTPDHDRLWFEQRPPRDFDLDG